MAKVVKLPAKRAWKAGQADLLRSDWQAYSRPINVDIRGALGFLRGRSRHEAQNNDHARAFLRECKANVIGAKGVQLQSRARLASGRADKGAQAIIEEHWNNWRAVGECDVTARLSFPDIERLAVEQTARDGEGLFRFVRGFDNRYGFALQALDPDLLDVQYTASENGRNIVMGVELDEWGRHVAYYFRQRTNQGLYAVGRKREYERVPANDIACIFLPEWAGQVRGIPWMATALRRMHDIEGYDESAVVAARAGASKMGFYTQDSDSTPIRDETGQSTGLADGEYSTGQLYQDFDPGTIGILPPGVGFEGWDPRYPHSEHGNFTKSVLRGIAAGLGVNYNTLSSDYEGVNYTSLRAAALSDRDLWKMLQEWLIGVFHQRVFSEWLHSALGMGALVGPRGRMLMQERHADLVRHEWQPRRWDWVDPQKDANAAQSEYEMRTRSLSSIIRERGQDPETVWLQIAEDNARLEALGIAPDQVNMTDSSEDDEA